MDDLKETFLETSQNALQRLTHLSLRDFWRYARDQGFSMTQMVALHQIYHRGDCNISDIGEELGVTHAASSQMLDRLVQQGYVTRDENQQDRRNKRIVITQKGESILHNSMQARQQWLVPLFETLTVEEAKAIITAMNLLIEKTAGLDEH